MFKQKHEDFEKVKNLMFFGYLTISAKIFTDFGLKLLDPPWGRQDYK